MYESRSFGQKSRSRVCEFSLEQKSKECDALTRHPAYVCRKCERSAAKSENLCWPERLFTAW
jgi:hypothetical protein